MMFDIGEKGWVKDDEEFDFVEGIVQRVFTDEETVLVTYETNYYYKEREFTFTELEEFHDIMFETASWAY